MRLALNQVDKLYWLHHMLANKKRLEVSMGACSGQYSNDIVLHFSQLVQKYIVMSSIITLSSFSCEAIDTLFDPYF